MKSTGLIHSQFQTSMYGKWGRVYGRRLLLPGGVDVEGEAGREDQELPGDATGEESTSKCRIFVCVFFLMSMPCATLRTSFLSLVGNSALRRRSIILLMYSSVPANAKPGNA